MARLASDGFFKNSGRGARTESIMQERSGHCGNETRNRHRNDNPKGSAFHGRMSMLMDEGQSGQWRFIPRPGRFCRKADWRNESDFPIMQDYFVLFEPVMCEYCLKSEALADVAPSVVSSGRINRKWLRPRSTQSD